MNINMEELYNYISKIDYNNNLIDLSFSRTAYTEYNRQWVFGIIDEDEEGDRDYIIYAYGSTINEAMIRFISKYYSEFLDRYKTYDSNKSTFNIKGKLNLRGKHGNEL